jgi:hypothetical protein
MAKTTRPVTDSMSENDDLGMLLYIVWKSGEDSM